MIGGQSALDRMLVEPIPTLAPITADVRPFNARLWEIVCKDGPLTINERTYMEECEALAQPNGPRDPALYERACRESE